MKKIEASALPTKWLGKEFFYKEVTDSTNLEIKRLAEAGHLEGAVAAAALQTAGRGRRGRSWQAERGENLLFSLLLRPKIEPQSASQITLLMALAVTKTLRSQYAVKAQIKWPNDVVLQGKKICGILTEMYLKGSQVDYIIVGTGLNVNQKKITPELAPMATSLFLQEGHCFSKEELLQTILLEFEELYESFVRAGSIQEWMPQYNAWLVSRNQEVRVLDPKGEYTGISRGINACGELLVELSEGGFREVYAGEVSVRGLYGYV